MTIALADLAKRRFTWRSCWYLVPVRFPPIDLFARIAPAADWPALAMLESQTDPQIRQERGELALMPAEERIAGPGAAVIMGPFTHLNPAGSRFSDGSFGVLHAARRIETAMAEARHARELFLSQAAAPPMEITLEAHVLDLEGRLHDLRGRGAELDDVFDPVDERAGQSLAATLRRAGSNGIVYDSPHHAGGQCIAGFRPRIFSGARAERRLCFVWDGSRIREIYEKRPIG
jgi:hypothetical protein